MAKAKEVLNILEQEAPAGPGAVAGGQIDGPKPAGFTSQTITQIQEILSKFGVKSTRSFTGWQLDGGLADASRGFVSLGVREDGFCVIAKSGKFTSQEAEENAKKLGDIITCLGELSSVHASVVAK
jgi:hypothetical protein